MQFAPTSSLPQHEMSLVNDDYMDGDGDINEYVQEIGTLTNNQLSLLSTLKEVSTRSQPDYASIFPDYLSNTPLYSLM